MILKNVQNIVQPPKTDSIISINCIVKQIRVRQGGSERINFSSPNRHQGHSELFKFPILYSYKECFKRSISGTCSITHNLFLILTPTLRFWPLLNRIRDHMLSHKQEGARIRSAHFSMLNFIKSLVYLNMHRYLGYQMLKFIIIARNIFMGECISFSFQL